MRVLKYFKWVSLDDLTADGNTRNEAIYVAGTEKIVLFVKVLEVMGTSPTLDLYVDVYDEQTERWYELAHVGTFTKEGHSMHTINVDGGQCFALRWVIGGTGTSMSLSVGAEFKGD